MTEDNLEPEYTLREEKFSQMRGGPLDGRVMALRRPKGVLVVDKVADIAWVYDLNEDGFLVCRDDSGTALDTEGRIRAAFENNYDVIAWSPEVTA